MPAECACVADQVGLGLAAGSQCRKLHERRGLRRDGGEAQDGAAAAGMPVGGRVLIVVQVACLCLIMLVMRMRRRSGTLMAVLVAGRVLIALMRMHHRQVDRIEGNGHRKRWRHRRKQIGDGDKPPHRLRLVPLIIRPAIPSGASHSSRCLHGQHQMRTMRNSPAHRYLDGRAALDGYQSCETLARQIFFENSGFWAVIKR